MSRDLRWTWRARLANGSHAPLVGTLRSISPWPRAMCLPLTPRQRDRIRLLTVRETPTVIDYGVGRWYPHQSETPTRSVDMKSRRGTSITLASVSRRR